MKLKVIRFSIVIVVSSVLFFSCSNRKTHTYTKYNHEFKRKRNVVFIDKNEKYLFESDYFNSFLIRGIKSNNELMNIRSVIISSSEENTVYQTEVYFKTINKRLLLPGYQTVREVILCMEDYNVIENEIINETKVDDLIVKYGLALK